MLKLKLVPPSLHIASETVFDTATYIGFLIFVLALPFGYSTVFLNIGLSFVLFGWVGRMISERKLNWQRTPLDLPIVLFLGLSLLACLLAPHPARSSLGYFWKLLRAILLFYAVIHSRLRNRWQHVVIAFIAAAGISSALGLWYYANDTRLAIDFMGRIGVQFQVELEAQKTQNGQISDELRAELRECSVPLSESAAILPSKQPDEWRIDDPARQRRYVVRKNETHLMVYMIEQRLTGTFKMPNDLGAYLALGLPFVMGYFVAGWRRYTEHQRNRIAIILVLGAVVILMSANLVLTLTRAAWISVTFATACLGVYLVISRGWVTQPRRIIQPLRRLESAGGLRRRMLLGSAAIIVIIGVSLFLMPQHIKTRFQTIIKQPIGFMGERPQWWQTSLELIRKYPLTGIGLGRFRYEYQHSGPPEQYNIPYHAHNIYLHIAVEHGIPALLLFLWMVVVICQQVYGIRQANGFWGSGTFIGASGFLISALIYGLADNILHQRTVLLFWFIVGIIFYIKDEKDEKTLETG